MKKIKVGIVNYLNTAPLIFGLKNSSVINRITLVPDYPSNLADSLVNGTIDLGLVPVAVIPRLTKWWLVGDYCIGADGAVASVCLFSDVPIQKVEKVLLDYQSRTSVELVKILLKEYWAVDVELMNAEPGFEHLITGTTAGVVIGDRSLRQRSMSPFIYDLGEAWKAFTGLPFVFAAWVSNSELDNDFVREFDEANAYGLSHLDQVIASVEKEFPDAEEYFKNRISYRLDESKRQGLRKFLGYLRVDEPRSGTISG